jgi:ammonia channel protein AmtB
LLVSGITWVLIAWIVLRLNATSITTVGVLLGVVFIVADANEVTVTTLVPGGVEGLALPDGVHLLPGRTVGAD